MTGSSSSRRRILNRSEVNQDEETHHRDSGEGRSSRSHSLPHGHHNHVRVLKRESSSGNLVRIFYALVRQGKVLRLYPVAFPLFRRNKSMKNMRVFSLRVEGDDEAILAIVLFGIVAHLVGHLQSLLGILTGSEGGQVRPRLVIDILLAAKLRKKNDYQQLADQKIWLNP